MATITAAQSQTVITSFEIARVKLIRWGVVMLAIYLVYLIFFPLNPTIHRADHILEIEQMLRHGRKWFAPFYVLGLGILFYAYWQQISIVHRLAKEDSHAARSLRGPVLVLGVLCSIILIGLYPITALDVALYVVRARLWALYGGSPMLAMPASFPHDPYITLAGEYHNEVSPYGPLWELIAQIPVRLGVLNIASGIIAMKLISLIFYIGTAVLIGWYARPDTNRNRADGLTAMTFFALNPMVLMEAIANGHNDMVMLFFMTLGLVLWQRNHWAWATLALTFASLIKVAGLILLPLFGMAVLLSAKDWRTRILRGVSMGAIFLLISGVAYHLTGPLSEVFAGAQHAAFGRWGYTPSFAIRVLAFDVYHHEQTLISVISTIGRGIFILYFVYLLIMVAQSKMTLVQAGFLAFFSQILLGTTFRIWYPIWLIPFAALYLTSHTFWRTFLFSLTAELSILMYLIAWRWILASWSWGLNGPLKAYWHFWLVMTPLTVPWTFGIPLLGPILRKWKDPQRFSNSLWIGSNVVWKDYPAKASKTM